MLVEVKNEGQSKQIRKITKLDETKVTVKEHATLNTVKGPIRYRNNPNFTEKAISEELKQYQVTEIF